MVQEVSGAKLFWCKTIRASKPSGVRVKGFWCRRSLVQDSFCVNGLQFIDLVKKMGVKFSAWMQWVGLRWFFLFAIYFSFQ